ncbi:hypothetical protein JCGZ_26570 [Jatropha curcas]|uniref:Uncharacterized protein n=1 Tax=Jatropha curcas TaxID=180498 RepID=A0A067JNL9_JATCU|nr:hypothetical protein JCGZ_26570 [Jatropha curcas]
MQLTFHTVAVYTYKQCKPLHGRVPVVSAWSELRDATMSAVLQDLEIGRLRRHQSRQSSAVTRLQMEVHRLRTRLEVEGIPLDFSEDEEDDDDGSSSDDAPPSPPSQAAASPSRRRR